MRLRRLLPIGLLCSASLYTACTSNSERKDQTSISDSKALSVFSSNCQSCHHATDDLPGQIAPSMAAIRQAYSTHYSSKEEFIQQFVGFVMDPKSDKSIVESALSTYGAMPKMNVDSADMHHLATYLYAVDLRSQEWKDAWLAFTSSKDSSAAEVDYYATGRTIANQTKAALGKNLLGAVKAHGAEGAIEFCNLRAIPITDSMAQVLHAEVRRVSDKPRNPNNLANAAELRQMELFKQGKTTGGTNETHLDVLEGKMVGYYPIEINDACLKCHGEPGSEINQATLKQITKLYPEDKATSYKPGDLRGLFVVKMDAPK